MARPVNLCFRFDSRWASDLFALVPRALLESLVSSATGVVLEALLKAFLRNLAADYARWTTDASYREARRQLLSSM